VQKTWKNTKNCHFLTKIVIFYQKSWKIMKNHEKLTKNVTFLKMIKNRQKFWNPIFWKPRFSISAFFQARELSRKCVLAGWPGSGRGPEPILPPNTPIGFFWDFVKKRHFFGSKKNIKNHHFFDIFWQFWWFLMIFGLFDQISTILGSKKPV